VPRTFGLLPIGRNKINEGVSSFALLPTGRNGAREGSSCFGLLPAGRSKVNGGPSWIGLPITGLEIFKALLASVGLLIVGRVVFKGDPLSDVLKPWSFLLASMHSLRISSSLSFFVAISFSTSRDDASGSDFLRRI
jgi:hypothetical protein